MAFLELLPATLDTQVAIALSIVVCITAFGMSVAYVIAEPHSPATLSLVVVQVTTGIAVVLTTLELTLHPDGRDVIWLVRIPVLELIIMIALLVWTLQVANSAQPTPRAMAWIRRCLWVFAAALVWYMVECLRYPHERLTQFVGCMGIPQGCDTPGFWIFAAPIGLLTVAYTIVFVILFTQRIDIAERFRATAVAISAPFFFSVYIVPFGYNAIATLIGLMIFLAGAIRYHTMQGERGVFMSRFLSAEVAKLVRLKGLEHTMQSQKLELTAVCCDLRGFTHFSHEHDSDQVTRLLGEYYEAVGSVVAEHGATIKDYAGDGILILVGAPLPLPDHAARGLALARRVLDAAQQVTRRWIRPDTPLGVGVGVASGKVTVGAIGSASRLEYTAVGQAVNVSSRLCESARDGDILVDARTAELAGGAGLETRGVLTIKGIGEVPHFACATP